MMEENVIGKIKNRLDLFGNSQARMRQKLQR